MPTAKASFESAEPAARNAAIVQAAKTRDAKSVPQLVRMLRSDDPATRVLAIRALEQITGHTLGFDAAGSDEQRARGIEAWEHSLAQPNAHAHPSGGPTP
jgi:HEAT repeat protein